MLKTRFLVETAEKEKKDRKERGKGRKSENG